MMAKTSEVNSACETSFTCRTLSDTHVHEALALWRQLESRIGSTSVACSATWTDIWLQVYGKLVPYEFFIIESNGTVQGICLLTHGAGQKDGPIPIRTLHVGTAGEPQPGSVCVEYNRLLVEEDAQDAFIAGLAQYIQQNRHWEQFRLDGFEESTLEAWKQYFPYAEVRRRDSRYFDLAAARDANSDVISLLGKSTRSNLRRQLKKYGEITCEWAEDVEQAEEFLQQLITLHQARWNAIGQPGAFASDRFHAFQLQATLRLFLEGKVVLFRVSHEESLVGCLLLLNDGNRLLDYLSGFASFEEKPSPGLISHYLCMEEALRRGFDAYDFLVGEKRHKENLSTHTAQLCWLTVSKPGWKRMLITTLRRLKQLPKKWRFTAR